MKKFELSIPKPCHENWDAMTADQQGRFCGACQKTVIDFTGMSDRQIAAFFKKPVGNVCGRFGGDQLNRIIEVPRKRIPWIKYFFTIALPAFLLSKKAAAQGEVRLKGKVAMCERPALIRGDTALLPPQKSQVPKVIRGSVVDESGNPLPGASVFIKNTNRGVATDELGKFKVELQNKNETELIISYVGFEMRTVNISEKDSISITLNSAMQGEVVVTLGLVVRKKPASVPLMPIKQTDTAFSKFSVFPNPADRNSVFTIETKDLEEGRYNLSIVTSNAEIVQTRELMIEKKTKRFSVQLENIAAAPYFIRLTNKANNKSYTEIILVK